MLDAFHWLGIPDWYYAILISFPMAESSKAGMHFLPAQLLELLENQAILTRRTAHFVHEEI